jgi:hypothetical protein
VQALIYLRQIFAFAFGKIKVRIIRALICLRAIAEGDSDSPLLAKLFGKIKARMMSELCSDHEKLIS